MHDGFCCKLEKPCGHEAHILESFVTSMQKYQSASAGMMAIMVQAQSIPEELIKTQMEQAGVDLPLKPSNNTEPPASGCSKEKPKTKTNTQIHIPSSDDDDMGYG